MKWYDSIDDAAAFAREGQSPIMLVISRTDNPADKQALEGLSSWQQMIELSNKKLGAVRIAHDSDKAKAIIAQMKVGAMPYVAWLDPHGNTVLGQNFPGSVNDINAVVNNFKSTLDALARYFKERQERGEKNLVRGRFRAAWMEFAFAAPLNGPDGEKARAGQEQVREQLLKLVASALDEPVGSRAREALFAGVRREAAGLSIATALENAITKHRNAPQRGAPVLAVADKAANDAAAAPDRMRNAGPDSGALSGSEESYSAAVAPQPPQEKPLVQMLQSQPGPVKQEEDVVADASILGAQNDDRLKKAQKLIEDGAKAYRKAIADNMERGPERNALLKDAREKFDAALTTVDAVLGDKPDPAISKLMERVSMMMYGCLKYQSL